MSNSTITVCVEILIPNPPRRGGVRENSFLSPSLATRPPVIEGMNFVRIYSSSARDRSLAVSESVLESIDETCVC